MIAFGRLSFWARATCKARKGIGLEWDEGLDAEWCEAPRPRCVTTMFFLLNLLLNLIQVIPRRYIFASANWGRAGTSTFTSPCRHGPCYFQGRNAGDNVSPSGDRSRDNICKSDTSSIRHTSDTMYRRPPIAITAIFPVSTGLHYCKMIYRRPPIAFVA